MLADDVRNSNCSPDGKSVIFTTPKKLYRIPIEGGTPTEILTTTPEWGVFMPSCSPDGTMLAMGYQEGRPVPVTKVGIVPVTGGALRFVGNYPFGAGVLHWSPDGKGIQYTLIRNGATNLWELPLAGGDPHQVTKFTAGRIFDYSWSRDGKQLLLTRGNDNHDVILITNFR